MSLGLYETLSEHANDLSHQDVDEWFFFLSSFVKGLKSNRFQNSVHVADSRLEGLLTKAICITNLCCIFHIKKILIIV